MSPTPFQQLDETFVSYRATLLQLLLRIVGNPAIAEELTQESYLRVRKSLYENRTIEHLKPFLFQTARNLGLDYLRAAKRQSNLMVSMESDDENDPFDNLPCPSPSPETIAADQQSARALADVLGTLSKRQQQAFLLSRVHGWSHNRIAEHLGISESTVQKEVKLVMAICINHMKSYSE